MFRDRAQRTRRNRRRTTLRLEALEPRILLNGTIWHVDDTAAGANNGTSWTDAFTDLQSALTAAVADDEVRVAAGTYKPTAGTGRTVSFELANGVELYGGFPDGGGDWASRDWETHVATLSGDLNGDDGPNWVNRDDNSYHVVHTAGEDATAVLDGFTIRGGNANVELTYPRDRGGGIFSDASDATLRNLTVTDNQAASYGGGVHEFNSDGTITDCTFIGNEAEYGGAMYLTGTGGAPTVTGCTFTGNVGTRHGGGVYAIQAQPTLTDALFENNTAIAGGGLYAEQGTVTVENSSFVGNQALGAGGASGGGIYSFRNDTTLVGVRFVGNTAVGAGGGLMHQSDGTLTFVNVSFLGNQAGDGGGAQLSNHDAASLTNVVFSGNATPGGGHGGGLAVSSGPLTLSDSTLSNNAAGFGGGIYLSLSAVVDVRNSVLWGNTATSLGSQIHRAGGTLTVQHSDVQGGWAGTNNIDADPLFVDADGADNTIGTDDDDLRVQAISPAINRGSNALLPADVADLDGDLDTGEALPHDRDGNPRVFETTVDMGAYENQSPNHAPVLDTSGDPTLDGLTEDPATNDGILVADLIGRLGGTGITDPDGGAQEGLAITGVESVGGFWQFSTDGGTTWTTIWTASDASAVLLADGVNDRVRLNPYADWSGTSTLTFRAWDQTDGRASGTTGVDVSVNGGATPHSSAAETASITVSPVEDAPTADFGKALDFDPATFDAVSIGIRTDGIAFAGNQDFTITMWVNHAGTGSQGLYDQDRSGNGEFGYALYISDQNRLTQCADIGGAGHQWGSTVIEPNELTHIAWVKTASTFRLYVNGVLAGSGGPSASGSAPTSSLRLGQITGSSLDGQMDEVGVWAKALDASEIQALLYRRPDPSHPAYGDLRAYWAFDDASGATAIDSAGGDNNGTLLGTTTGPAWVDSTVRRWSGYEGAPIAGQAIGNDADGDALTFAKATDPAKGGATVDPDGSFTYTVTPGQVGDDSFDYTVDDGHGSAATGTVHVTTLGALRVVATDPADAADAEIAAGQVTLTVDFSRPVAAATVGTDDLAVSAGTVSDAVLSDPDTVVYTIDLDQEGTVTYDFAFDALASDPDGYPLLDYSGSFEADFGVTDYPVPLTAKAPPGSLIYDPTAQGSLYDATDVDAFTIDLDAGQTATVAVTPADPSLVLTADLYEPGNPAAIATATAAAGEPVLLDAVALAIAGIHRIEVSTSAGSGDYTAQLTLNAAQEHEGVTDPANSNDALAAAQDIDASFLTLSGGLSRGAVLGTFDGGASFGPDGFGYYAVPVSTAFEDISGTGTVTLEDEDDAYAELTAADLGGFQFPFYGTVYTDLYFNSNGLITFSYGDSDYGVYDLTDTPDQPAIAVLWDDLEVASNATPYGVYWEVLGSGADERLIIQWHNIAYLSGDWDDPITFQAVLFGNGDIQLNYLDITGGNTDHDEGAAAAVGIKDDGTQGANRLLLVYENGPNAFVGSGQSTLITTSPPAGTPDYYAVTLGAGEPVTLGLTPQGAGGSLSLELRDAADTVLATGVAGPTNLGLVIDGFVPAGAGTYYARVAGVGGDYSLIGLAGGAFDQEANDDLASAQDISGSVLPVLGGLTADAAPMGAESEPNDDGGPLEEDAMSAGDAAAANDLSGDFEDLGGGAWESTLTAYVDADNEDFFSFRASGGDTVTIEVESYNASDWDSYLELYDSTLAEVAWDDDGGTDTFSRIEDETLAGAADQVFYIKVRGYDGTEGGEYLLRVTLDAPQPAVPPESDFYAFTVADGDELTLWTELPGGLLGEFVNDLDPYLRLYDSTGTLVAEDDSSGIGPNARIDHTVGAGEAGTWTVEVAAAGDQGGEYLLLADQVSAGPVEAARLAKGQVILYDTDATSLLDADVDASDVRIWYDRAGAVRQVAIYGNPTGLGILVKPNGDRSVSVYDSRRVAAAARENLSFLYLTGPARTISLRSRVDGWNLNGIVTAEGLGVDVDLDGDGGTADATAIHAGGPVYYLYATGGFDGDVVVRGANTRGYAVTTFQVSSGSVGPLADIATPDGGIYRFRQYRGNFDGRMQANGNVRYFYVSRGLFQGQAAIAGSMYSVSLYSGAQNGVLDVTGDVTYFRSYGAFADSILTMGGGTRSARFYGAVDSSLVNVVGNAGSVSFSRDVLSSTVGLQGYTSRLDTYYGQVDGNSDFVLGNVGLARFRRQVDADVMFLNDMTGRVYLYRGTAPTASLTFNQDLRGRVSSSRGLGPVAIAGDLLGLLDARLFSDVGIVGDFTGRIGGRYTANGPATLILNSAMTLDGYVYRRPGRLVNVTGAVPGFNGAFADIAVV